MAATRSVLILLASETFDTCPTGYTHRAAHLSVEIEPSVDAVKRLSKKVRADANLLNYLNRMCEIRAQIRDREVPITFHFKANECKFALGDRDAIVSTPVESGFSVDNNSLLLSEESL